MRKHADRLLVAVYVVLATLPLIALVLGIRGRDVFGALPPKPRPKLAWRAVLSEKYQHQLTAWFESNLGLKGTSIAIDNGLLYRVFGETKPGAPVRVGLDRVLFLDEDIGYFNKRGGMLPAPEYVDKIVGQVADVQRRMAAEGRAFVPVIAPAKTSIWRDKVPARWKLDAADPPLSDIRVYRAFVESLDRHGVRYVDAREILTTSTLPREQLWAPDARHWSDYGGCLAMREVARIYDELTTSPALRSYDCTLALVQGRRHVHGDYDLWRVLNAYGVKTRVSRVAQVHHHPPPPNERRPSMMFIGSSFGWAIVMDAHRSGLFSAHMMNYYNQTFTPYPEGEQFKVEPGTERWRTTVIGRDLYVLDLFESYLGAPGSYVELFLAELLAELDRPTRAR